MKKKLIFMPILCPLRSGGGAKDVRGMYFWTADIRQNTKYVVDIVSKPNPRIVNPFIQKESIISHEINLSLL